MKIPKELDIDLEKLFNEAQPINDHDLEAMAQGTREIMESPAFRAGILKDDFIHHILEGLEENHLSQSELARRCGKTRQYLNKLLNEDRRVNYTLDTLVEIMHHLGRCVEVIYPRKNEVDITLSCPPRQTSLPKSSMWGRRSTVIKPIPTFVSAPYKSDRTDNSTQNEFLPAA